MNEKGVAIESILIVIIVTGLFIGLGKKIAEPPCEKCSDDQKMSIEEEK